MATTSSIASTASTTNAASYTSSAFTPAVNDLLLVMVWASDTLATGAVTNTAGTTFSEILSIFNNGHGLYCFVANSLVTSTASQTVTFTCTGDNATGSVIHIAKVTGMSRTGLSAILQSNSAAVATSTVPTGTLASFTTSGNSAVCVYGVSDAAATSAAQAALTVPSGFTKGTGGTNSYSNRGSISEYAWKDGGVSVDTAAWSTSADAGAVAMFEIDASAAPSSSEKFGPVVMRAGGVI